MPRLLLLCPSCEERAWRRRSRSTSTTRLPAMARVMARFIATNVLPACGSEEVKWTLWTVLPEETFMKVMFERRIRKASESGSRPVSRTTMPFLVSPSKVGMSPRKGTLRLSSMSLRPRIVVSSMPIRKSSPNGMARPAISAMHKMIIDRGATGAALP